MAGMFTFKDVDSIMTEARGFLLDTPPQQIVLEDVS